MMLLNKESYNTKFYKAVVMMMMLWAEGDIQGHIVADDNGDDVTG